MTPETRLEDAFVRWRFGQAGAAQEAEAAARAVLAGGDVGPHAAQAHLRLAQLLSAARPEEAARHVEAARALGAAIPHNLWRAPPSDETAPAPSESRTLRIESAARRSFVPPRWGDAWHPAFDLAARSMPPLDLTVLRGGFVSVDTTGHRPALHVFDADQRLAADLSWGPEPFLAAPTPVPGPLVVIDDAFGGFNVCHFLFDRLPRLAAYQRAWPGRTLQALAFQDHPYHRDAVRRAGHGLIAPPPGTRVTYAAEDIGVVGNLRRGEILHPAWSGAGWAAAFLDERYRGGGRGEARLYVSRADAAVRGLVNEAEVRALFESHGFQTVVLTGLDFEAQRALFAGAGVIAGVHGAGLANLAFMPPGGRVIEIMPPLAGTFAYWVMAQAMGHDYALFTAEDAEHAVGPGAQYDAALGDRPLRVDLLRLDRLVEAVLA